MANNFDMNTSRLLQFSGFQKGLTLLPSSTGSKVISFPVKVNLNPNFLVPSFALSCDGLFSDSAEDQFCECKPNYIGDRCEACGPGYFGEPDTDDGFCQPCQCNGNIDVTDHQACDRITGLCQLCLYNTNFCYRRPFFFLP